MDTTLILSTHLKHLIERIEANQLSGDELRRVSEFVMRECMFQYLRANGTSQCAEDEKWMKYLTLGWFIYEHLGVEGHTRIIPSNEGES